MSLRLTVTKLLASNKTYFGSGGPSANGFMESLHRDLKTKKASFCRICENGSGTLVESTNSSSLIGGKDGMLLVDTGPWLEVTEDFSSEKVVKK